ncbi:MAG: TIGR02757 family protein [bacterium]
MRPKINKIRLEALYRTHNRRENVHPDPLEFLYHYENLSDREIVGLIASSLAYGRVEQILKSVSTVLERMPEPYYFLNSSSLKSLRLTFRDFKHRFTTGEDLSIMLFGAKRIIQEYGSLYECFRTGLNDEDGSVFPALGLFTRRLMGSDLCRKNTLIPSPFKGSACKRMNLFLRWMVREDDVDPGGWERVPASKLIVPLDTHLHRISLALHMTERRQADIKTAREITCAFRRITPDDPVRYDFTLTRLGIWQVDSTPEILNQLVY